MERNLDVRYWMQQFGVSKHALDLAVQAVGCNADDVRAFIERARTSCRSTAAYKEPQGCDPSGATPTKETKAHEYWTERVECLHYVSRSASALSAGSLHAIVSWSRGYNPLHAITGVLLYTGSHFSQILEGPSASLECLMESIRKDPRHQDVRILYQSASMKRRFQNWSMALLEDPGLQDLLHELWWAQRLDAHRAAELAQHLLYKLSERPS